MSEERFVDLETRLAHQDQMLHELNEVVTDQQAKLMQLEELCRSLVDRVRSLGEGIQQGDPASERPPHY
jgi:SlyX protein